MRSDAVRGKNANTLSLRRNAKVTSKGSQTSAFDSLNGNIGKDWVYRLKSMVWKQELQAMLISVCSFQGGHLCCL